MSLPILTKVFVIDKRENEFKGNDGVTRKCFNVRVVENKDSYDTMNITVPEDVYNQIKEKEEIKLKGYIGRKGADKFWGFREIVK